MRWLKITLRARATICPSSFPHFPSWGTVIRTRRIALAAIGLATAAVGAVALPQAGASRTAPVTSGALHFDTSRSLVGLARTPARPVTDRIIHEQGTRPALVGRPKVRDLAIQATSAGASEVAAVRSFDGLGDASYGYTVNAVPPDTSGAPGDSQYMQWINSDLAVFSKSDGSRLLGPVTGNTLFAGFGGPCQTHNDGDPIVQFDQIAHRWVVTQFVASAPYMECVAVSTTPSALGSWNRYSFPLKAFGDYPKLSVWPDAYYISYDMFNGETGAKVCALDRAAMLVGRPASQQCFQRDADFAMLAADLDGSRLPPKGMAEPVLALSTIDHTLHAWRFHVDWRNPARTSFDGPTTVRPAAYNDAACAPEIATNLINCIPQPVGPVGYVNGLDPLADRLMFRLAYRRLANGADMLTAVQTIGAPLPAISSIRWYQLKGSQGSWDVTQQGTFAPDSTNRFMPSMAADKQGNILIGYSTSGQTSFAALKVAGRRASDPAGQLRDESTVASALGAQLAVSRWGDYTQMEPDPSNDCVLWFTGQYIKSAGLFNWSTRIAAFRFPTCR